MNVWRLKSLNEISLLHVSCLFHKIFFLFQLVSCWLRAIRQLISGISTLLCGNWKRNDFRGNVIISNYNYSLRFGVVTAHSLPCVSVYLSRSLKQLRLHWTNRGIISNATWLKIDEKQMFLRFPGIGVIVLNGKGTLETNLASPKYTLRIHYDKSFKMKCN